MRIKIEGTVISKSIADKKNYNHELYSAIIQHLSPEVGAKFHQKDRELRLFTFTDVYLTKISRDEMLFHVYIAGEDTLLMNLIQGLRDSELFWLGDMCVGIDQIKEIHSLKKQNSYLFKTKVIINNPHNQEQRLMQDIEEFERRLRLNTLKKAEKLGITGDINFRVIQPKVNVEQYKQGHIFSWKCLLDVRGDFELVEMIYQVGVGENTATGHGFLFEANRKGW